MKNKTDPDEGVSWALGDGFNLRLLIHYVGDIHQPLHTVSRFAEDFPNGDMGGNLFMLAEKDGINELHALWDSTIYEWDQDIPRPLSEEGWTQLGEISQKLREEHKLSDQDIVEDLKKGEKEWAQEGYEISTSFLYNIEQNSLPSDEYVAEAQKIVHRRLALGGYRLAQVLT